MSCWIYNIQNTRVAESERYPSMFQRIAWETREGAIERAVCIAAPKKFKKLEMPKKWKVYWGKLLHEKWSSSREEVWGLQPTRPYGWAVLELIFCHHVLWMLNKKLQNSMFLFLGFYLPRTDSFLSPHCLLLEREFALIMKRNLNVNFWKTMEPLRLWVRDYCMSRYIQDSYGRWNYELAVFFIWKFTIT